MALDPTIELIGGLGNRLAQQHYAATTDADGTLPQLPTDADRQALTEELGRAPTTEEEQAFEAGYRESMLRLSGNARAPELAAPLWKELQGLLGRYGYTLPPDGTPELNEAKVLFTRVLSAIREKLAALTQPGVPDPTMRQSDAQDAATSARVDEGQSNQSPKDAPQV